MSLEGKIDRLVDRLAEVEALLSNPEVAKNAKEYKKLSSEHAHLTELFETKKALDLAKKALVENEDLYKEEQEGDLKELLKEDITKISFEIPELEKKILTLLVPPNPDDHRNILLELRAGTGGEEAALFVADCCRMYRMYADQKKWTFSLMSISEAEMGGLKEAIYSVTGPNVYKVMKFEAGTHRVQRVPTTEAQGRIHTSTITVAVMLEPDEEEDIEFDPKDLQIDTYRSSGAGGQHVNTTDSAVRITHLPTGTAVYCQEERSQIKNREKAMTLLKARLLDKERRAKEAERAQTRQEQVGTGERSERIRTYNFPQNRLTDHRVNFTSYNLDRVMDGYLNEVSSALLEDEAKKALAAAI